MCRRATYLSAEDIVSSFVCIYTLCTQDVTTFFLYLFMFTSEASQKEKNLSFSSIKETCYEEADEKRFSLPSKLFSVAQREHFGHNQERCRRRSGSDCHVKDAGACLGRENCLPTSTLVSRSASKRVARSLFQRHTTTPSYGGFSVSPLQQQ